MLGGMLTLIHKILPFFHLYCSLKSHVSILYLFHIIMNLLPFIYMYVCMRALYIFLFFLVKALYILKMMFYGFSLSHPTETKAL